jgi:hypothetical protein
MRQDAGADGRPVWAAALDDRITRVGGLKVKKVFIIDDTGAYGVGIADAFEAQARKDDITVLGHDQVNPLEADYTTILTKIKGIDPEAPEPRCGKRNLISSDDPKHAENLRKFTMSNKIRAYRPCLISQLPLPFDLFRCPMRNSDQSIIHGQAMFCTVCGPYGEYTGPLSHQDVASNAIADVDRMVMRYSFRRTDFREDRRIWFRLMEAKLDDFLHRKTTEPVLRHWTDRDGSFSAINSSKKIEKLQPVESVYRSV